MICMAKKTKKTNKKEAELLPEALPETPTITGPTMGKKEEKIVFHPSTIDPDNNPVSFFIDWGDERTTQTYEYASGEEGWESHTYHEKGNFTIMIKAKDTLGEESDWGSFDIEIIGKGKNKPLTNPLFLQLFDRLIDQFPLLRQLLGL